MKISVLIPARNEERYVGSAVESAMSGSPWEVIVVDGASEDGTAAVAAAGGAAVVDSPPGRGVQLDLGARAATGDALLFLHADCRLPPDYADHVGTTLVQPGVAAGAFRLRIDVPRRSLRLVEWTVSLRCRLFQMPYGDQAIFTGAETYFRAGGFPPLPAMEDFELVRRLRKLGRIRVAGASVLTSGRGWIARGVWRTTLLNRACIAAYRLGVSPERIARWRQMGAGRAERSLQAGPDPLRDRLTGSRQRA